MRAEVRQIDGYHHEVEIDGHVIVVDEPAAEGGTNAGPAPTRLLAASLASCTAITIQMYAARKGWDVSGLGVAVEFGGSPKAGEAAQFVIELTLPAGLSDEQAERITVIGGKCPVHRVLTGPVEIEMRSHLADG